MMTDTSHYDRQYYLSLKRKSLTCAYKDNHLYLCMNNVACCSLYSLYNRVFRIELTMYFQGYNFRFYLFRDTAGQERFHTITSKIDLFIFYDCIFFI
jgi:hypothetical protein